MKYLLFSTLFLFTAFYSPRSDKAFVFDGKRIKVNHEIGKKFVGKYQGKTGGYLILNEDGTGTYKYDYSFGTCSNSPIPISWGLIKADNGSPVSFSRKYGKSYPIFFQSQDGKRFRGCQEEVLEDYLLVYKDGSIEVSTSDDWKKID